MKSLICVSVCICLSVVGALSSAAYAQKSLDYYLSLSGKAQIDSLEYQQVVYWEQEDSTEVFPKIQRIKAYAQQHKDGILSIFSDHLKGLYYLRGKQKSQQKVVGYFDLCLKALEKEPNSPLKDLVKAHIAFFGSLSQYINDTYIAQKFIDQFLMADLIYQKIGYENILFATDRLTYLGVYYLNVEEPESAGKYLEQAERFIDKTPVDLHKIRFYKEMAKYQLSRKKYSEAIRYNLLGIAQVRQKKDSVRIGSINGNIGEIILRHTSRPLEAEPYFRKELWYRLRFAPNGYDDIAVLYGNLCHIAGIKGNQQEVTAYYQKAVDAIRLEKNTTKTQDALLTIYQNRFTADSLLGDYKSAFKYQRLHHEVFKKRLNRQLKVVTSEATVKFEAERFKLQAELANQQARNSRFWIIIISLVLIMVLAGAYAAYKFQQNKQSKIAQQLAFEQKEAERLAELDGLKNRFFANISHEFRTPLTLILSPLQDILKASPDNATFRAMKRNAERLLALINQLLELSKLEGGTAELQLRAVDVVQFFEYVFSSFESLAQNQHVLFQYEQSHEHWTGLIDTDKVQKITTNLLSNAFKFTPDHGRIRVRVSYAEDQLRLKVQDFGIGITPEQIPHIFDRFYQGDSQDSRHYEGTGIGLALVKELINVLRGSIDVTSKMGEGTTFLVTLPCPVARPSDLSATQTPLSTLLADPYLNTQTLGSSNNHNQETEALAERTEGVLLLVEDNQDLRSYIRKQFEASYQIVEARDGQEGIEKATETVPDLVICDLMMPRLDGFGFCKQLKSNEITSHIPVVMLTAKATLENRLEGLELGADDYLAKPFHADELKIRVRNLIEIRQSLRQKFSHALANQTSSSLPQHPLDDGFLQKIRGIIEQHIADAQFDVETLAEPMSISSVQLRRKLKALTGQTAIEFVRNYRLEKAAAMLKNKQGNVSEVAYSVGFESLSYFSRSFQDKFGKKPSEW
jgi:signal transduction histidine kinase/CheY-like chemotaxis protein